MKENLIFRKAGVDDILDVVELVWKDQLRQEDSVRPPKNIDYYFDYFHIINRDVNQYLLVVENEDKNIIATSHLTLLHYLPFLDRRLQVEFVRVDKKYHGQGIGRKMFEWIEEKAKEWEVSRIQLTTDKRRMRAQQFYQSLGYEPSHIGMKLYFNK